MSSIVVLSLEDLFFSSGKTPTGMDVRHTMEEGGCHEIIKLLKCTRNKKSKKNRNGVEGGSSIASSVAMLEHAAVGLESCVIKDGSGAGEAADEEHG